MSINLIDYTCFIIEPFKNLVNIEVGRRVNDKDFINITKIILEYFEKHKDFRTLKDIDYAIEYLKEKVNLVKYEELKEDKIDEIIEEIKTSIDNYFEKNRNKITLAFKNPKAKRIIPYWISNFDLTIKILFDSLDISKNQKKKIIALKRQSKQTKDYIAKKLEDIFKAIFLVLLRIVEQIFLIIDNKEFDLNREINLLIRDIVYLKNVQRKSELMKY